MNIIYLASYQYFGDFHAGYTHTYFMAKHISKLGHTVHLVMKSKLGKKTSLKLKNRLYLHFANWHTRLRHFPVYWSTILRGVPMINRLAKKYDIDIIHERYRVPGGVGCLSSMLSDIPCVLEVNYPYVKEQFDNKILYKIVKLNEKFQMRLCSKIITQTNILKEVLDGMGIYVDVEVVPNGADPGVFNPSKIDHNLRKQFGNTKIVGYVGSFRLWHGVPDLMKAFKTVKTKFKNCKLMLIGGTNRQISEFKSLADRLRISNDVIFVGSIPYQKIPYYLSCMDVCVAPFNTFYHKELRKHGMWYSPLKIFEYMSMGKPVICPDIGMLSKYIENAGLKYTEGDIEELSQHIIRLFNDENLSTTLGRNGRRKIETEYNWKIQAEKTVAIYTDILKR